MTNDDKDVNITEALNTIKNGGLIDENATNQLHKKHLGTVTFECFETSQKLILDLHDFGDGLVSMEIGFEGVPKTVFETAASRVFKMYEVLISGLESKGIVK